MKSLKSLLIPFIIMIVLVIVAVVALVSNNNSSVTVESGSDNRLQVINIDNSLISSIEVLNRDGSGIGFQSTINADGVTVWSLLDQYDDGSAINSSGVGNWVVVLSSFMADVDLGNSSELNLAEYGLDDPVYTIIITNYDGTVSRIFVGNKTTDGNSCYFMVEGDPDVYTIVAAKYTYCGYQLIDFLETSTFDFEYGDLSTVEFERYADDLDLVASCELYETGDPMFTAISPFKIKCSTYFANLIEDIKTLEITSYLDIPDDMLADYGLDDPAYSFTFTLNDGRVITITLSSLINGNYYGTCSEFDGYFQANEMQISGLNTQLLILLDNYLVYYPATEMSKISGTYGDESFVFDIETDGSISAEDATALLNMRNAKVFTSEGRSYAAILYESLITINITGIDTEADPEFEPEVEFEYITTGHETITLSFVPKDNNNYYVFYNGEYSSFTVARSELFNDGGTNTFNYGAWAAYELTVEAIDNSISGIYDIPEETEAA
ncbi:MAG: DUF4340 domain-containing protein [Clostridiales bacterium]|nr:DUF4340 domain-containing protein [Clostridiales bacterium]